MFLIFGTNDCKYCKFAINLLIERDVTFRYVSLDDLYGKNWKDIFDKLKHVKTLTTIPIIFSSLRLSLNREGHEAETDIFKDIDFERITDDWKLIGSYFDLVDFFEEVDDREILKLDLDY